MDKYAATRKAYALKNKEAITALNKDWYKANKEEKIAKSKSYYKANKEANKEKEAARKKAYYLGNKNKVEANNAKRRALMLNADSTMTESEKENYRNLVKIRDDATKLFGYKWSIEHIIPLSKGGTNAIDNLEVTPLSWNIAKNNRSSESFWG